jgi:hypothetical protein
MRWVTTPDDQHLSFPDAVNEQIIIAIVPDSQELSLNENHVRERVTLRLVDASGVMVQQFAPDEQGYPTWRAVSESAPQAVHKENHDNGTHQPPVDGCLWCAKEAVSANG